MRVFVTGATGFIGSALVPELIAAGHQVLGMARSDAGASALTAAGAEVHRGDLNDLETLRTGAAQADGVIHTAFIHDAFQANDFSRFQEVCDIDRRAIEALGATLEGTGRPLIVTSGTAIGSTAYGQLATEDYVNFNNPNPRVASERTAAALAERGVNISVMRLPQVHDTVKQGLITYAITVARQKGISAYVGDGKNRWPAAHVSDVARLYRLAIENATPGARWHAVAEEGIPVRGIAEAIGRGLNVPVVSLTPEEAPAHFGFLAMFAGADIPASSALTRQRLNWSPTGPSLLTDLENMKYHA